MELREIKTFLQVTNSQSFSKAAEILGYSQAAVTIHIKQLEDELGVRLFDRLGKQTSLTHDGEIFFEHANRIMQDVMNAKEATGASKEMNGVLRIGTIDSIASTLLPQIVSEFHEKYPFVSIKVILGSPDVLLQNMTKNQLDLVYLLDKRISDIRWNNIMQVQEEVVFVTSPDNELAKSRELILEDILDQPFILTERNASYRFILDQFLAFFKLEITPYLEIGSTEFIVRMLQREHAISYLPRFTVEKELCAGTLVTLPVTKFRKDSTEEMDFPHQVWRQLIYHQDKWVTREMDAFINMIH